MMEKEKNTTENFVFDFDVEQPDGTIKTEQVVWGPGIINVDKVADIPKDYYGKIGVPITFIDKWNQEQFEIINSLVLRGTVNGTGKYARVVIRRKGQFADIIKQLVGTDYDK